MKPLLQILHIAKLSVYSLALSGVLVSCSDLLEKNPPSAISDNTFWTGENDAYLALVGCYRFQTGWSHDDFATPQGLLYLDFAGGNGTEKENFTTLMASSNTVATNSILSGIGRMPIHRLQNTIIFWLMLGNVQWMKILEKNGVQK